MKLQDQVITAEQAKRLFELGVKCEKPAYHWIFDCGMKWDLHPIGYYYLEEEGIEYFPAYTVAELGVMLPTDSEGAGMYFTWKDKGDFKGKEIDGFSAFMNEDGGYNHACNTGYCLYPTEAQARGALLIHLLETGIITAEQCNASLTP